MNEEKEFRTLKTDESKFGAEKKETGLGELLEETFGMKVKSLLKKIREKAKDPKYIKTTIIIVIILILGIIIFMALLKKDEGPKSLELSPEEKAKRENVIKVNKVYEESGLKPLTNEEVSAQAKENQKILRENNFKPLTEEEKTRRLKALEDF